MARTPDRRRGDRRVADRRSPNQTVNPRRRLVGLLAVFVFIGLAFIAVLVDLQLIDAEENRAIGEGQRERQVELAGYRGSIVDRTGFVFATSTPGYSVVVDPSMVVDPGRAASLIAPALGLDQAVVHQTLLPEVEGDRYNVVVESISDAQVEALNEARSADEDGILDGLFVQRQEERVYPADTLARPVVGGVDPDETGIFGLEQQYDDMMQGSAGYELSERGVFGSITGGQYLVEPAVQGNTLMLSVDHRIQFVAEQALIEHCEDTLANNATAVVSDPNSGEILAMATVIRFEDGSCGVPNYNATLVDTFEPGSVLKIVTAAAAVEELGYTADTMVEVPTEIVIDGQVFKEGHGQEFVAAPYPLAQIIERSMNVGTVRVAQAIGEETLHEYLGAFGFGQMTGLDFIGESRGNVRDVEDWYGTDLYSIPIGQGLTANAVQINSAFNVIANDGLYIQPRLVRAVIDEDGNELPSEPQASRTVVSPETARIVNDMLVGVVHNEKGTGTQAAVPGYTTAGKTGTAWKVLTEGVNAGTFGEDGDREYVVTFSGFLPAENPALSITVVVDEPVTETSAGLVAAPVFADIAQYAARILDIPPASVTEVASTGLVQGTPASVDGQPAASPDDAAATSTDSAAAVITESAASAPNGGNISPDDGVDE